MWTCVVCWLSSWLHLSPYKGWPPAPFHHMCLLLCTHIASPVLSSEWQERVVNMALAKGIPIPNRTDFEWPPPPGTPMHLHSDRIWPRCLCLAYNIAPLICLTVVIYSNNYIRLKCVAVFRSRVYLNIEYWICVICYCTNTRMYHKRQTVLTHQCENAWFNYQLRLSNPWEGQEDQWIAVILCPRVCQYSLR